APLWREWSCSFLFSWNQGAVNMNKQKIESSQAPQAIGPYSQAIRSGGIVYLSGQIPLDPATMMLVEGDMTVQTRRVFANLQAVCEAAGGGLEGIVKLTIYLTDLAHFPLVNDVMKQYFTEPYPARVT